MRQYYNRDACTLYTTLLMGCIKHCTVSVHPSVHPCLRFSRNSIAVGASNLAEIQLWTRVARGANLRSAGQIKGQAHWERKCENGFLLMFSSTVDRCTSNEDQNYHRPTLPTLHISSNTFHQ